jgi:hypothetical protein
MSRYATLMEPSTAPPKPDARDRAKHTPEVPVTPLAGSSVTQSAITSAPTVPTSNQALGEATDSIEPERSSAQGSISLASDDVSIENLEPSLLRTDERTFQRSTDRTTKRMVKRSNVRTIERPKIRHTFDILADQLLSLKDIALERQKSFGPRVLLGELVQEALDLFIAKERNND